MTVLILSNMVAGTTGLDKSVVMTANGLHRAGYHVVVVNMIGSGDGSSHILARWPFDSGIVVQPLRTLAAAGGTLLARGYHSVLSGSHGPVTYRFSENELAALRQINAAMRPTDTIIFTHPLQARAFQVALEEDARRPRTILQIHGDYRSDTTGLWETTLAARDVVDTVQTVADPMRTQFVGTFGEESVVWIPNIQESDAVARRQHDGIDIAVIGSFQERKNQLDAVRALAQIQDERVGLTLWGGNKTGYADEVRETVSALGLEQRVRIPGLGTENEIYGSADIVLMPSLSEGFPYVLTEAACHGLPIVAYDFEFGPRDAIEEGESGFIVPLGDVDQLADRLARLASDAELRHNFGARSRDVYDKLLSPERILAGYRSLLGAAGNGQGLDLAAQFPHGREPVATHEISHRFYRTGGQRLHVITVRAEVQLYDVRIDNGGRTRDARTMRRSGATVIAFSARGNEVISYATQPGSADRYYLGNTTSKDGFESLPYLRRDASLGTVDAIHAPAGKTAAQRRVARHPSRPVVGGIDNFGDGLNRPGGVVVKNSGSPLAPTVSIGGEYDWLVLRDAAGERRVAPPYGYVELFERLCAVERDSGLFEITTREGVHAWELYRAAFVSQICEALGMWGKHFAPGVVVRDVYVGSKLLSAAPSARRVLFEFPRKSTDIDPRTQQFAGDDTLVVSYPQTSGYSAQVERSDHVFPIYEYCLWRRSSQRTPAKAVDSRPFEAALSAALDLDVVLGDQLKGRVQKFLDEREFWTPVFERIQPEEVVIPSAHWSAGIVAAARRAGAQTSDVQYALTGRCHPSYWFGDQPRHGAHRLYSWSSFWSPRANGYQETVVAPRHLPELEVAEEVIASDDPTWDVCFVSQTRVFRRVMAFLQALLRDRPEISVVVAPHPDERDTIAAKLSALGLQGRVSVAVSSTLETISRSAIVVGGYSTSLYEAAFLGRPTYVLPVPGHELTLQDVRSGLFRLATAPADLVGYEVPANRERIFEGMREGPSTAPS